MRCKRTLLAIIASTALVHAASAQQKPDKVVIGYLNLVNAQLVTKALGLHEKEMGVPIEWVKFGSGGDVNRAVAANQLSLGGAQVAQTPDIQTIAAAQHAGDGHDAVLLGQRWDGDRANYFQNKEVSYLLSCYSGGWNAGLCAKKCTQLGRKSHTTF